MRIYLLYYDNDGSGGREEWSVFYTPCEAFPNKKLRNERKDFISKQNPNLTFHEETVTIRETADFAGDF